MSRIALFTSAFSEVAEYLLFRQTRHEVTLVDFSTRGDLAPAAEKSKVHYVIFDGWKNLRVQLPIQDLIVSYKLPKIVPEDILGMPGNGAYNIHPSLLPAYRGINPWYDLYYDGQLNTGVTLHRMSMTPDCGRIMIQRDLTLEFGEPLPLALKLSERLSAEMLREFLDKMIYLDNGIPQKGETTTHSGRTIESIRALPIERMWHLFRGFPMLLKKVFPELPHEYFEVGEFYIGNTTAEAKVADDCSCIEIGDGAITLIDFGRGGIWPATISKPSKIGLVTQETTKRQYPALLP